MGYSVRKAEVQDAAVIAKVNVDTWRTAYKGLIPDEQLARLTYAEREKFYTEYITNNENALVYVGENEKGEVVGYALGGPERSCAGEFQGEVYAIYVLQENQGKGMGRLLFQAVVEDLSHAGMTSVMVWVLANNPYRSFYEALGGAPAGSKRYQDHGIEIEVTAYGWQDASTERKKANE